MSEPLPLLLLVELVDEPDVEGVELDSFEPESLEDDSLEVELDSFDEPPPSFELDSLDPLDSFEPPFFEELESPSFEAEPDELGLGPLDDEARESVLYQPLPLKTMPTG